MTKKYFINSAGKKIYLELGYPKNKKTPINAIVVAHGLRSYYTGFLNMFAKSIREAGYISVKFHFLGTGKSDGKFEEKNTVAMLQNYKDVIDFLKKHPDIKNIGVMARSNAGSLAALAGKDSRIKAYVLLASPAYYSKVMKTFTVGTKIKGNFFYNKSFERKHTKGPGRLPFSFIDDVKKFDKPLLQAIKKISPVAFFQSTEDEAVKMSDGHFDYWKKNLRGPRKIYIIKGGNHSYKGHKRFVIDESLKWFKKFL